MARRNTLWKVPVLVLGGIAAFAVGAVIRAHGLTKSAAAPVLSSTTAPPQPSTPSTEPSSSTVSSPPPKVAPYGGYRNQITGTIPTSGFIVFPVELVGPRGAVDTEAMLDTGAQVSLASSTLLRTIGLTSGAPSVVDGVGGSVQTHLWKGLTIVPQKAEGPRPAPLAVQISVYGGWNRLPAQDIGQGKIGMDIGQDILNEIGARFTESGNTWTLQWTPATTAIPTPTQTLPAPSSLPATPGYLGVTVANPPGDWTVSGCEVLNVLPGTPAAGMGLVGAQNRTDPVGDVITRLSDQTSGKTWFIGNCTTLQKALGKTSPGQTVTVSFFHRQVFVTGRWVRESRMGVLSSPRSAGI